MVGKFYSSLAKLIGKTTGNDGAVARLQLTAMGEGGRVRRESTQAARSPHTRRSDPLELAPAMPQ